MKPETVYVHWSENRLLTADREFLFAEFEQLAFAAAQSNPPGSGYDKVMVTVRFDNGELYKCRLDLCQKEDQGFRSHVEGVKRFAGTDRFEQLPEYQRAGYEELVKFFDQIDWTPPVEVKSWDVSQLRPNTNITSHQRRVKAPTEAEAKLEYAKLTVSIPDGTRLVARHITDRELSYEAVVRKLIREMKKRGFRPYRLWEGEAWEGLKGLTQHQIIRLALCTDHTVLRFCTATGKKLDFKTLSFVFIWGNEQWESIADHTDHPVASEVADLIANHFEK